MAVTMVRTDDIDGTPASEFAFAYPVPAEVDAEGNVTRESEVAWFDIDLGDENRAKWQTILGELAKYSKRRDNKARPARSAAASSDDDPDRSAYLDRVRAWAPSAGHQMAEKGRAPSRVLAAYNDAVPNDPYVVGLKAAATVSAPVPAGVATVPADLPPAPEAPTEAPAVPAGADGALAEKVTTPRKR